MRIMAAFGRRHFEKTPYIYIYVLIIVVYIYRDMFIHHIVRCQGFFQ